MAVKQQSRRAASRLKLIVFITILVSGILFVAVVLLAPSVAERKIPTRPAVDRQPYASIRPAVVETEAPMIPATDKPTDQADDFLSGPKVDWPAGDEKRSFMWVFVYCAGQNQGGPLVEATSLADLLSLALKLDFQVLVCLPNMPSAPPPPHHPRLHWLPKDAQELFEPEPASQSRAAEWAESVATSPLGFLRQIEMINEKLEFRKLMVLSPFVSLGETQAEAQENIERLWAVFDDRYREDDITTVTALLLSRRPDSTELRYTDKQTLEFIPATVDDPLRFLRQPQRTVIAFGFNAYEAVAGLVTLAARHMGAMEDNAALTLAEVDAPSGQLTITSKAALDRSLTAAIQRWEGVANGTLYDALKLPKWKDLTVCASLTASARVDLALASMHFQRVVAAPVRVVLMESGKADPDQYATRLRAELLSFAQGGPHVKPEIQSASLYNGIDDLLPRTISMSPWLRQRYLSRIDEELQNEVAVYWDPYCSCTGINIEAINFLVSLEHRLQVRAVANPDCWCRGFPESDDSALRRMSKPRLGTGDDVVGMTKSFLEREIHGSTKRRPSIWITHKPVDAFPTFPYRGAIHYGSRPTYHVGRTMIEVDRISREWVDRVNSDAVDEIWVPSKFLVDAFYASGVHKAKKIFVVPEAIDTAAYDPETVAPLPTIVGHDSPCPHCFKFFSNFKWEDRKGWDILLHAYFTTFSAENNVALYIKTYLYMSPNSHDPNAIQQRILAYARDTLRLDPARLPRFYVLADETDAREMPRIYKSMDAFVLPTRGEGWGLPFQEAMAMGLPTIGTNWGGNVDFMSRENSYLIDIEGLAPPGGQVGGYGADSVKQRRALTPVGENAAPRGPENPLCAEPSAKHLAHIMRHVFHNPEDARDVGKRGRATIVAQFSREAVSGTVIARIRAILGK